MKFLDPRKVGHDVLFNVLKNMARLRLAVPAAFVLWVVTRISTGFDGGSRGRVKNILMLPKETFVEDVKASLGKSGQFRIYSVWRMSFKALSLGFLPYTVDDNFYVSNDSAMARGKELYRKFLAKMWSTYGRLLRIDAVVTGNFSYFAERELASMLEARGVPFIVMHKENMKSPGREDWFIDLYRSRRGPFTGRRMLVYNEIERSVQLRAGVVSEDRVSVCGMPRLDRMHAWRREHAGTRKDAGAKLVLFFAFTAKTGLPRIGRKRRAGFDQGRETLAQGVEELAWTDLVRETHRSITRFAREHPHVTVIVKTKRPERDWAPVAAALGGEGALPGNLKLVRGGDPMRMVAEADVVVGFNTTGLLEAMAAGKAVVVPWFSEALDPKMKPYAIDLSGAAELAGTPRELIALLRHHVQASAAVALDLRPPCLRALEHWCGNADGAAGERIRRAVIAELGGEAEHRQSRAGGAHA